MNFNNLKKLDKDDLLHLVGLETRRDTVDTLLPVVGAFAAGILVGAGLGLLLAPKTGDQLRDDLRQRLQSGQDYLNNAVGRGEGSQATTGPQGTVSRTA
ncbi:hypothetical protein A176_004308 [Myxococcus hansupus]|uniref:YtxH domain-containing protein n=2 Tax=Pseudomyxococcus hansupus TaxID=1297742 RepID=A0A0H4WVG6_9BACT|nr:YtxH domain-containing protein [Myxococcus hansupus]AKQ67396.1 hypothetical protein A176_004308 [Myxococcus hansupus]